MFRFNVVSHSANRKLTSDPKRKPFATTYQGIETCPASCPFKDAGCYAQEGFVSFAWRNAEKREPASAAVFGREILGAMLAQRTERPRVRLSVAGDLTQEAVDAARDAVVKARALGLRPLVFGFTHRWRTLDAKRSRIPGAFMLRASVDSIEEKREAERAGWSVAITLPVETVAGVHETRTGRDWRAKNNRPMLVCPQQTDERADCADCMACMSPARAIGFRIHGLRAIKRQTRKAVNA